ncbi:hypothetical protein A2U01_0083777, partial [Trifolium medium]|nr:hypothetical protein [Trifolium medium]
ANLGFQPVNPVAFDIKNTMLSALKEDQYSGFESQCLNLNVRISMSGFESRTSGFVYSSIL